MGKKKFRPNKKVTPSKKSPQLLVAEQTGASTDGNWKESAKKTKAKILDGIAEYLDRRPNESVADLKDRLLNNKGSISNKKLLRLQRNANRLKDEFGGKKSNLIDQILKARAEDGKKEDTSYRAHLEKKSIATLLLQYDHSN